MRQILWMATLGFGLLLLPALPAGAQKSVTVEDVRAIAFDKGIVEIKESSSTTAFGKSRAGIRMAARSK